MKPNSVKFLIEENNVTYFAWWTVCRDFTKSSILKNYIGKPYASQLIVFRNGDAKWATSLNTWNQYGTMLIDKIKKKDFPLSRLEADHKKYGEATMRICQEIENTNIKQINNKQLTKWFRDLFDNYLKLNEAGFVPVTSDLEHNLLTNYLKSILTAKRISESKIQGYMTALMMDDTETLFWQEQKELIELAVSYPTKDTLQKSQKFLAHASRYHWINYGYKGPAWKVEDFLQRIEKLEQNTRKLRKALKEHVQFLNKIKTKRIKLERHLKLNTREKQAFATARVFSFLKTYRVQVRYRFCATAYKLFNELGKRYRLPIVFFEYATEDELFSLLKGKKANKAKVIARKKFFSELQEGNRRKEFTKRQMEGLLKKILIKENITATDSVTGQAAFLGKVIGPVKLINSPKDIHKFNKGDILVAVYTDPNLLPAMEKAAAFVTDQGGITSHAAIVAREMKKPCIIGTKYSTKIFKDGDLVEVDANRGTVRKLT